jgi:PTH1 family peptidyl-tRNA hydrolase
LNKFLITGLGNIGEEYEFTRHNVGFDVVDALAKSLVKEDENPGKKFFMNDKLAFVNHSKFKGKQLILIKPTTYMNLSGKAVNYWLQNEKIPLQNLLVITDDLALPFGSLRMKKKGSDGGHNGLSNIAETLNSTDYARLRFGIGSDFQKGQQVNYVLSRWNADQEKVLPNRIEMAVEMIKSFISVGIDRTMTAYNKK